MFEKKFVPRVIDWGEYPPRLYLIQRAYFKPFPEEITGIDALLSFDYMGSAEFEFGALGFALAILTRSHTKKKQKSLLITEDTFVIPEDVKTREGAERSLTFFFPIEYSETQRKYFMDYFWSFSKEDRPRTKEYVGLDKYLFEEPTRWGRVECWWDIGHHFLVCPSSKAEDIRKGLQALAEKSFAEGWQERNKTQRSFFDRSSGIWFY